MNYPESSDSETGADSKRTWSASGYYSNEQSPRTRKKPSSAGSSRKRNTSLIKRTASMDSIDLLRSVPLASSGKGLSEKVATILILLNLDQANRPLKTLPSLFFITKALLYYSHLLVTHIFQFFAVTLILKVRGSGSSGTAYC